MTMNTTNFYNRLRLLIALLIGRAALMACATESEKTRLF